MNALSIGEASDRCGVKIPTIRYYEQIGLLPAPRRSESNRRFYGVADVKRLSFIRHARELGFDVEAIRTFLKLQEQPDQSCEIADRLATERLRDVQERIDALTVLKGELQRMVENCKKGQVSDCRVIETLADHAHCLAEHR